MANFLQITPVTLNRYEKFKRDMPFKLIIEYSNYLGYEIRLLKK